MSQPIADISRYLDATEFYLSPIHSFPSFSTTLYAKPQVFTLKDSGRKCKLEIEDDSNGQFKNYLLWIDQTLVTELTRAPAIEKEDIPDVCQSENFVFNGEVTVRTTFNVFVKGILSQIVADHNRRSLCTILEVDGKLVEQWNGVTLDKLSETPYTFYVNG